MLQMNGSSSHRKRARRMYQAAPQQAVVSQEIGLIDASTVSIRFNFYVAASNYVTGVTVTVNGVAATVSSATRQTDHSVVHYVLSVPVDANDIVTWEYNAAVGNYVSENTDDQPALASFGAVPVTNYVALVPPLIDTAEIGTVAATTVVVTYTTAVLASNYKTGISIKVNGVLATVSTATSQVNHAVVRYVIPAVVNGDTVTIEYDATLGDYSDENDGALMANIAATAVTNNVP